MSGHIPSQILSTYDIVTHAIKYIHTYCFFFANITCVHIGRGCGLHILHLSPTYIDSLTWIENIWYIFRYVIYMYMQNLHIMYTSCTCSMYHNIMFHIRYIYIYLYILHVHKRSLHVLKKHTSMHAYTHTHTHIPFIDAYMHASLDKTAWNYNMKLNEIIWNCMKLNYVALCNIIYILGAHMHNLFYSAYHYFTMFLVSVFLDWTHQECLQESRGHRLAVTSEAQCDVVWDVAFLGKWNANLWVTAQHPFLVPCGPCMAMPYAPLWKLAV